jgi:hypothetical protein
MKDVLAALCLALPAALAWGAPAPEPPPATLSATGLFKNASEKTLSAGVASFTPQYPLWSDGATKRRWVSLPAGGAIDATRPAAWDFPVGTRLWKEFSVDGRRVETRFLERLADGSWRFAAYVWNGDETEATLAPADGLPSHVLPGGRRYAIPSEADCRACHEGAASPVLGFSALQLSPDRDPLAPHGEPAKNGDLDLRALIAGKRMINLPRELAKTPPRIAAPTPAGRAALGYLHANCGHCHADPRLMGAAVPVELQLAIDPFDPAAGEAAIARLLNGMSRYRPRGAADARYVVPGNAQAGTLLARMRSRDARIQMPPLGSAQPDLEALALFERWITEDLNTPRETTP